MKKLYFSFMTLLTTQTCLSMLKSRPPTPRPEDENVRLLRSAYVSSSNFLGIVTGTIEHTPPNERDSSIPTVIPLSPPRSPVLEVRSYNQVQPTTYKRTCCIASGLLGFMFTVGLIIQRCVTS